MKILTPEGFVLVLSSGRPRYPLKRDPWLSHHDGMFFPLAQTCASGMVVASFRFITIDPSGGGINFGDFFYPSGMFTSHERANLYLDGWREYKSPSGVVGAYGEWFNYVARRSVFAKVDQADWVNWLSTH